MKFPKLAPRTWLVLLSLGCGLGGFGLVFAGLWMVYKPAALVFAGLSLVAYAWRVDRAVSSLRPPKCHVEG